MGFGAIIAFGVKNTPLPEKLTGCITEVRVEQFLDKPTGFAIRFQGDIQRGNPTPEGEPELGCGELITIAVKVGNKYKCLVRGPITDVESSVMLGGPGSWVQIQGSDRRIELDRVCFQHPWSGLESAAANEILKGKFDEVRCQKTKKEYGSTRKVKGESTTETLNQRDTDEAFLSQIARRNNMHFWLEYKCEKLDPSGSLKVTEIANLRSSPLRPQDEKCVSPGPTKVDTDGDKLLSLRVNVEKEGCFNVTTFSLKTNTERPTSFKGTAINMRDVRAVKISDVKDRQPPVVKGGLGLGNSSINRELCLVTAGDEQELQCKAESAMTEAGWFVEAKADTTVHMLGGVLVPHDEVKVQGVGTKDQGRYHVKSVTHVINAADHFMEVHLRRNAIGGKKNGNC